jgi:hypothetical protein
MKEIKCFKTKDDALEQLDNGGRVYNMLYTGPWHR